MLLEEESVSETLAVLTLSLPYNFPRHVLMHLSRKIVGYSQGEKRFSVFEVPCGKVGRNRKC